MKKLIFDNETKNLIGFLEGENLSDEGELWTIGPDFDDSIDYAKAGYYLADDGALKFDENRIVEADPNQPPESVETLETV